MANIVEQICTQIKVIASAQLGASYTEMRRVFEPDQNDFRTATKSYGVRPLGASSSEGVLRVYTLDHRFEILLMRSVVERNDDSLRLAAIYELYDKASEIFKNLEATKINLASIVLVVNDPAMDEVERLTNNTVLLRQSFNVKYRESIV